MVWLRLLWARFRKVNANQVAASLAFTTLLSLIPLITLIVVMLAQLPLAEQLGSVLRMFLQENLLPDKAGRVIATYAVQFSQKASRLTALGTGLLALTSLTLLLTIERALNAMFAIQKPRPWLRRLGLYSVVVLIGPVAMGGAIVASTYLLGISLGLLNEPVWVRDILLKALPLGLTGSFIGFLFYAIPNCAVRPLHALLGGGLAALGLAGLQSGLAWFLANFPTWSVIYGAFAVVPIFLVWLYLSWLVILLGALLVAVWSGRAGVATAKAPRSR